MKTAGKLMLISIILFMGFKVIAQNNNQDVVYLKNGSIIRGNIIEFIPDKHIKIETIGGNLFVFQVSEIEKCTKEAMYQSETTINSPPPTPKQDAGGISRGYYGVVELGTGVTGGYMSGPFRTKLNFISGYRVNPWFAFGGGFGLRSYPDIESFMPFFIDLRANFMDNKTTPYMSLQTGYSVCLSGPNMGGFMMSPTFGVSKKLKNRTTINMGLSYELQRTKANYFWEDWYYVYPYYYDRVSSHTFSFVFGFSF